MAQGLVIAGDFPNGSQAFGSACIANNGSAVNTCSGNGDGVIWNSIDGPGQGYRGESAHFWQHLKLAGLLSDCVCDGGGASGDSRGATTTPFPAYNKTARWAIGAFVSGQSYFHLATPKANYFMLTSGGAEDYKLSPGTAIVKPANALAIDAKIDDGNPFSGEVLGTNDIGNGGEGDQDGPYGTRNCLSNGGKYYIAFPNDKYGCNMAFELKKNW